MKSKIAILTLGALCAATGSIQAAKAYAPVETAVLSTVKDGSYEFKFNANDDIFRLGVNGNSSAYNSLLSCVEENLSGIRQGNIPVYVESYSSSETTNAANLATAKTRANRVKSELIEKKGLAESCFITSNYAGQGDYVIVRIGKAAAKPATDGCCKAKAADDSVKDALAGQIASLQSQLNTLQSRTNELEAKANRPAPAPAPMPCCAEGDGHKAKKIKAIGSDEDFNKFRFGGYGEMVASFLNYGTNRYSGLSSGNTHEHRNTISIPRFVFAFDYKFSPRWVLGTEIEFESGGVGFAQELEPTENMEYEYELEKGGEVALEQFHITYKAFPWLNIRAGHMIVPVGLTNSHHEPINFFGTSRPEGETTIIPSTWHETGLAISGTFGKGYANFDYEAMVVAGLNADGFSRDNWVASGKQGIFETDNFSSPGYAARINYNGVPGLRIGVSGYYCHDVTKNADKVYKYSRTGQSAVKILSADAQYKNKYVTARANIIWGELDNASKISSVNSSNSSNSYASGKFRVTAKNAICYGAEVGLNLQSIFHAPKCPVFYPFARYDYYNPQQTGEGKQVMDPRCQVSKWTAGLNWYALPNLVVKADYTTRHIGTQKLFGSTKYNNENEFSIGIAYVGWFTKR